MFKEPNVGTLEFYRTRDAAETALTLPLFLSLASTDLSYKPREGSPSARDIHWTAVKGQRAESFLRFRFLFVVGLCPLAELFLEMFFFMCFPFSCPRQTVHSALDPH